MNILKLDLCTLNVLHITTLMCQKRRYWGNLLWRGGGSKYPFKGAERKLWVKGIWFSTRVGKGW